MFYKIILSLTLLFIIQNTYASSFYFLCGSDEDGCAEGREQYCACIPVNANPDQPYCLDLIEMSCRPSTEHSPCDAIVDHQPRCLATLYQSQPDPACKMVPESFCKEHSVPICDENGNPSSCKISA